MTWINRLGLGLAALALACAPALAQTISYSPNTLPLSGSCGTVTAVAPCLDLTQTWNNAGVTFTGLKFNATDTASAAGSLLMDLEVAGSRKFSVDKSGSVNVYGTFTDASNYESLYVKGTGTEFRIGTARAGTGTARPLYLESDSTGRWQVTTSGHFLAFTDNTYDIGAAGANRPRSGYFAGNLLAGGNLSAGAAGYVNWTGRSAMFSPADGNVLLQNNASTSFGLLQFGGTTSSFPALKRNGANLDARLADDSGWSAVNAGVFIAKNAYIQTAVTTVASLTTCNAGLEGARQGVTDATATTFLSAVVGGGANHVPVYCDGTSWKIG